MGVKVPVHAFSEDEKMWYAKLLVQAALEDSEVTSTEMDYLVMDNFIIYKNEQNKNLITTEYSLNFTPD